MNFQLNASYETTALLNNQITSSEILSPDSWRGHSLTIMYRNQDSESNNYCLFDCVHITKNYMHWVFS